MAPKKAQIVPPPLVKGELTKYGYSSKLDTHARHKALVDAVAAYGKAHVIHKLNAVAVLNKNRAPHLSKIFRDDQEWLSSSKYDEYAGFLSKIAKYPKKGLPYPSHTSSRTVDEE